MNVIGIRITSD